LFRTQLSTESVAIPDGETVVSRRSLLSAYFFAGGEVPIETASTITLPTGQLLVIWLEEQGALGLRRGLEEEEPLDLQIYLADGRRLGPYPSETDEPMIPPIHHIPAADTSLFMTLGGVLALVPRDIGH
jgi:hypothetical protein